MRGFCLNDEILAYCGLFVVNLSMKNCLSGTRDGKLLIDIKYQISNNISYNINKHNRGLVSFNLLKYDMEQKIGKNMQYFHVLYN